MIFGKKKQTSLETLTGEVSNLRSSTVVSGNVRKGKGRVSSSENLNFLIDGKAVSLGDGERVNLSDGDKLTVAGRSSNIGLGAMAFYNHTNGTYGENGSFIKWFGWGFYIFAGLWVLVSLVEKEFELIWFPLIPALIGRWLWKVGKEYEQALKLCMPK